MKGKIKKVMFWIILSFISILFSVIISIAAPTISSITFKPDTLYTNTDANCSGIVSDDVGGVFNVTVQWYINSTANETETMLNLANNTFFNFTLDSSNFVKTNNITCELYAFNGTVNSSFANTSKLVSNSVPSASSVAITPATAYTTTNLIGNFTFTDSDSDIDYSFYNWYINDILNLSGSFPRMEIFHYGEDMDFNLIDSIQSAGQGWDDEIMSWFNGTPQINVDDFPNVQVTFIKEYSVTIPQTQQWVNLHYSEHSRKGTLTNKNSIRIIVQAYNQSSSAYEEVDNYNHNLWDSGECLIREFNITDTDYWTNGTLQLIFNHTPNNKNTGGTSGSGTCDGHTVNTAYYSYINFSYGWLERSSTTFTNGNFSKGDDIILEVFPNDGTVNGTAVNSSTTTILNTAPSISDVNITPNVSVYTNTTTLEGWCNSTDTDNDDVSIYYYRWYKNDTLNESGILPASYCYQETANVSTACGGLSTGTYSQSGDDWCEGGCASDRFNLIIDGNWTTKALPNLAGSGSFGYVNYTKPSNAINATWQIKDDDGIANLTVPSICFSQTPLQLRFRGQESVDDTYWECWNGTDWDTLKQLYSSYAYEEAIWWGYSTGAEIDTITSSETTKNQNWTFSCSVNDGTDNSTWSNSTTITILNLAPSASNVNITPTTAYTNSTLTGAYTFYDGDGDANSSYRNWYVNDSLVASGTDTLASGNFSKNNNVTYEVIPNDGTVNGTAVNSSVLTISNLAPETLSPSIPTTYTNTTANCSATHSDVDGDAATIWVQWYVNDTINETSSLASISDGALANFTLDSSNYLKGWNITCELWSGDGTDNSSKVNSTTVVISNTVPGAPSVTYPVAGNTYNTEPITITWTNSSADIDDDDITYYAEYSSGGAYTLIGTANASSVLWNAGSLSPGTYTIKLTPYDQEGNGTADTTGSFTLQYSGGTGSTSARARAIAGLSTTSEGFTLDDNICEFSKGENRENSPDCKPTAKSYWRCLLSAKDCYDDKMRNEALIFVGALGLLGFAGAKGFYPRYPKRKKKGILP
jgi:hypothetical protein